MYHMDPATNDMSIRVGVSSVTVAVHEWCRCGQQLLTLRCPVFYYSF